MPRILLVEDNELNRDMLSRRLARRGHQVIVAVDGGAALALAESERPDLILMDMSLPVLDGWEATRRLKAAPATRSIPVIALTAHAMDADRERSLEDGRLELGRVEDGRGGVSLPVGYGGAFAPPPQSGLAWLRFPSGPDRRDAGPRSAVFRQRSRDENYRRIARP